MCTRSAYNHIPLLIPQFFYCTHTPVLRPDARQGARRVQAHCTRRRLVQDELAAAGAARHWQLGLASSGKWRLFLVCRERCRVPVTGSAPEPESLGRRWPRASLLVRRDLSRRTAGFRRELDVGERRTRWRSEQLESGQQHAADWRRRQHHNRVLAQRYRHSSHQQLLERARFLVRFRCHREGLGVERASSGYTSAARLTPN